MQFSILIASFIFLAHILHMLLCYFIDLLFLNRFFHETLVDQNFGKAKFWQNFDI